jgi:hypothetical protein
MLPWGALNVQKDNAHQLYLLGKEQDAQRLQ